MGERKPKAGEVLKRDEEPDLDQFVAEFESKCTAETRTIHSSFEPGCLTE
jgi:hypothetical protein